MNIVPRISPSAVTVRRRLRVRALPRSGWPATVIVTAHDTYAIDAFDHDALDYLLKPFGDTRARGDSARKTSRACARWR